MAKRPEVPAEWVQRIRTVLEEFPGCKEEEAWVGMRWRVGQSTVAHVFGGEDQLFRITFRAEPDEVMAFRNLGAPYFGTDWSDNVVGLLLDESTNWSELSELLTDSYRIQAPARLTRQMRSEST